LFFGKSYAVLPDFPPIIIGKLGFFLIIAQVQPDDFREVYNVSVVWRKQAVFLIRNGAMTVWNDVIF
jgi:hypothetical protein